MGETQFATSGQSEGPFYVLFWEHRYVRSSQTVTHFHFARINQAIQSPHTEVVFSKNLSWFCGLSESFCRQRWLKNQMLLLFLLLCSTFQVIVPKKHAERVPINCCIDVGWTPSINQSIVDQRENMMTTPECSYRIFGQRSRCHSAVLKQLWLSRNTFEPSENRKIWAARFSVNLKCCKIFFILSSENVVF